MLPIALNYLQSRCFLNEYLTAELMYVLSDVKFKNVQSLAADLTAVNEIYMNITGKKIGGLIGCDFLLGKVKSIDFKKKVMTVKTKKKAL